MGDFEQYQIGQLDLLSSSWLPWLLRRGYVAAT